MAKVTGRDAVRRYMLAVPDYCREKLLPGAAKAMGKVIVEEAARLCTSERVAKDITSKVTVDGDIIRITISVKRGMSYSLGVWLEYGTAPHFIGVMGGVGPRRNNKKLRDAKGNLTLVIGGQPVGPEVFHTGSRPFPFLRPAIDIKDAEARRAGQAYINAKLKRGGLMGPSGGEDDA